VHVGGGEPLQLRRGERQSVGNGARIADEQGQRLRVRRDQA
jgi:hypothetical protein